MTPLQFDQSMITISQYHNAFLSDAFIVLLTSQFLRILAAQRTRCYLGSSSLRLHAHMMRSDDLYKTRRRWQKGYHSQSAFRSFSPAHARFSIYTFNMNSFVSFKSNILSNWIYSRLITYKSMNRINNYCAHISWALYSIFLWMSKLQINILKKHDTCRFFLLSLPPWLPPLPTTATPPHLPPRTDAHTAPGTAPPPPMGPIPRPPMLGGFWRPWSWAWLRRGIQWLLPGICLCIFFLIYVRVSNWSVAIWWTFHYVSAYGLNKR